MTEILFIVREDHEGYHAKAVGAGIFTQAATREELVKNVRDAVLCHYDSPEFTPKIAHLHYVHDETIAIARTQGAEPSLPTSEIVESLKGSILSDDDPFGPAAPLEDWETLKETESTRLRHSDDDICRSKFIRRGLKDTVTHYDRPDDPVVAD